MSSEVTYTYGQLKVSRGFLVFVRVFSLLPLTFFRPHYWLPVEKKKNKPPEDLFLSFLFIQLYSLSKM